MTTGNRPRIGVSSCLLGAPVRYDGGHKRVAWVVEELASACDLVVLCPEMGIGLGTPRPPIHLVSLAGDVRARGVTDPTLDVTDALRAYARASAVDYPNLNGYVFKSRSPSCALTDAPVSGATAGPRAGIYALAFQDAAPLLPTIDEVGIADAAMRAHFIERVFAFRRWQGFRAAPVTASGLVAFHTKHKLTLMAHDEATYRVLGTLLADLTVQPLPQITAEYELKFLQALAMPVTIGRHVDVLTHAAGFFKKVLSAAEKRAYRETLLQLHNGDSGLDEAISQLRGFMARYPQSYLADQTYLAVPPGEWRLRFGATPVNTKPG